MSAPEHVTMTSAADGPAADERRFGGPAEGWPALLLTAFLALIVAWSIDDPAWVNGRGSLTDCLAGFALAGWAVGLVGAKARWGRWVTHVVGALLAGFVVPVVAGWTMVPGLSPEAAFRYTATGTAEAWLDLAWRGLRFTTQEVHYLLVLGGVVWGTGQFLSYAVFRHRRPLAGVLVAGLVLLANMTLTGRDQLAMLVAYAAASLFLLIGMHAFDERVTWARRRIGDPGAVASLYLRGGTVFILLAMVASMVLTQRAASAPLASAWDGVDEQLVRVAQEFQKFFPAGGDYRGGGGVTFGPTAQIVSRWFSDGGTAFTATVPTDVTVQHWRAATYDTFALRAWIQTGVTSYPTTAGDPLVGGTAEEPEPGFARDVTTRIIRDGYLDSLVVSPGTPLETDQAANVLLAGDDGWLAGVVLPGSANQYELKSSVLLFGGETGLTGNELRAATEAYPAEVTALYTAVPDGALGPKARELLSQIMAEADRRFAGLASAEGTGRVDPYDLAMFMQTYLSSGDHFAYTTDLTGFPCDADSAVECFAQTRHGYCLHYASTMAILLRAAYPDDPIPTRLVQGFLPGERTGGTVTVRNRDAHAWVEVYFPGYGWIPFDPTGGQVGRPSVIPAGPPVASAKPTPGGSRSTPRPIVSRRPDQEPGGAGQGGGGTGNRPGDRLVFGILGGLLALLVLAGILAAWLRGPRGEVSPEAAWRSLLRSASRFGFAPRPTQTVYEYADGLARLVPAAGGDLDVVATARVETIYGKATLGEDRLSAVRAATRRLRVSLLRLITLRGARRSMPRRPKGRFRRR